ncbi:hypothetical protein ACFJGW_15475 [Burkholderiaceae bacterium UC74_6]
MRACASFIPFWSRSSRQLRQRIQLNGRPMFRYIALACDASQLDAVALAAQLGDRWRQQPGWTVTLQRRGLHVYAHGETPAANQAHVLPGGQGVVLGQLFRRQDLGDRELPTGRSSSLLPQEAARVLEGGGQFLIHAFWGRYVAFLQSGEGTTCVIRDPSGTLPCHLIRFEGVCIVFSWLEDLLMLLEPDGWTRPSVRMPWPSSFCMAP